MIEKKVLIDPETANYAEQFTKPESAICRKVAEATDIELQYADMLSGRIEGRLLAMLVAISGAKRILELGTFTGYSALSMAEALPEDGELITIEMNSRYSDMAKRHFAMSEHGKKITLKFGLVKEVLPTVQGKFDLIFLDANKDDYPEYYEMLMPQLRISGLLVVDNVLWYGGVLKDEKDRKSARIHQLNSIILTDKRVENVLLPVRDGVQIVRKLSD